MSTNRVNETDPDDRRPILVSVDCSKALRMAQLDDVPVTIVNTPNAAKEEE